MLKTLIRTSNNKRDRVGAYTVCELDDKVGGLRTKTKESIRVLLLRDISFPQHLHAKALSVKPSK